MKKGRGKLHFCQFADIIAEKFRFFGNCGESTAQGNSQGVKCRNASQVLVGELKCDTVETCSERRS